MNVNNYLIDVVAGEGSVGGHQEMAAGRRYEGCDNADKVIVHVSWVSEGLRTGCHHCCYLHVQVKS